MLVDPRKWYGAGLLVVRGAECCFGIPYQQRKMRQKPAAVVNNQADLGPRNDTNRQTTEIMIMKKAKWQRV